MPGVGHCVGALIDVFITNIITIYLAPSNGTECAGSSPKLVSLSAVGPCDVKDGAPNRIQELKKEYRGLKINGLDVLAPHRVPASNYEENLCVKFKLLLHIPGVIRVSGFLGSLLRYLSRKNILFANVIKWFRFANCRNFPCH